MKINEEETENLDWVYSTSHPPTPRPAQITDKANSKGEFLHFQAIIAKKLEVGEGLS